MQASHAIAGSRSRSCVACRWEGRNGVFPEGKEILIRDLAFFNSPVSDPANCEAHFSGFPEAAFQANLWLATLAG